MPGGERGLSDRRTGHVAAPLRAGILAADGEERAPRSPPDNSPPLARPLRPSNTRPHYTAPAGSGPDRAGGPGRDLNRDFKNGPEAPGTVCAPYQPSGAALSEWGRQKIKGPHLEPSLETKKGPSGPWLIGGGLCPPETCVPSKIRNRLSSRSGGWARERGAAPPTKRRAQPGALITGRRPRLPGGAVHPNTTEEPPSCRVAPAGLVSPAGTIFLSAAPAEPGALA